MAAELRKFLRFGHHEALAVTSNNDLTPHASPMGVEFSGTQLLLRPYTSTTTYRNLMVRPYLTLNFTQDARYFFQALLRPGELGFRTGRRGNVPVICGDFDLYVEGHASLAGVEGVRAVFLIDFDDVYTGTGSRLALSRANNALLEALTYYTKVKALAGAGNEHADAVSDYLNLIELNLTLVRRLGGGELVDMADELEEALRRLVGGGLRQGW
ncbi:MAG: DUF447 family protein [Zestosphaera sp.]